MSRAFAHPLALVLPFTLAFALACGGGSTTPPAPPAPPAPVGPTTPPAPVAPPVAPPAPVAKTFDTAAWTCCDAERASRLLDQYFDVSARLVKGDNDRINGQYTALKGVAQGAIDNGGFSAEDNALLKKIIANSDASTKADIAGKRKIFKDISADTIAFLKHHNSSGSVKAAVAHCPMFEGGADWIQKDASLANPYMGEAMLKCGSFQ